jgi:hypothetical protein
MKSFKLGDLTIKREPKYPFFWLVKRKGIVIDRDQYSNDIRDRFDRGEYKEDHDCEGYIATREEIL